MEKIRLGIVGMQPGRSWGAIAHMPALAELGDLYEVTAVANSNIQSARAAADAFGIPHAFGSAAELAASPDVDLVVITVKVPHHLALAEEAAKNGKHVLSEWPLGNGLAEARTMADMVAKAGVRGFCCEQARFSPTLAYARDLVADGYLGDLLSVAIIGSGLNWGGFVESPNAYTNDRTNGATMLTIPVGHTIDGLAPVIGELASVNALLANRIDSALVIDTGETMPQTSHDEVLVQGLLANGAPLSLHYRGGMPRGTGLLIELRGSAGELRIGSIGGHAQLLDLTLSGGKGEEKALADMPVPESYSAGLAAAATPGNIARLYKQMAADLRDGTQGVASFADAVRRHQTIAAIEQAASTGCAARPDAQ